MAGQAGRPSEATRISMRTPIPSGTKAGVVLLSGAVAAVWLAAGVDSAMGWGFRGGFGGFRGGGGFGGFHGGFGGFRGGGGFHDSAPRFGDGGFADRSSDAGFGRGGFGSSTM